MSEVGRRLIAAAEQAAEIARQGEVQLMLSPEKLLIAISGHVDEHFGPRCSDFDPDCMTCQMWAALGVIGRGLEESGAFAAQE